mgnify:CR=1 FL=1
MPGVEGWVNQNRILLTLLVVAACLGRPGPGEAGDPDALRREAETLTTRAMAVIESENQPPDGAVMARARDDFERASALWERLGDRQQLGRSLRGVANTCAQLNEWDRAAEAAIAARAIAEEVGDLELLSEVLGELAGVRLEQGRNAEAEAIFIRVAELALELGQSRQHHTMLHNLASSYAVRLAYQDALDTHRRALTFARKAGLDDKELSSLIAVASIHLRLGDPERASRRFVEVVELAEERGDRRREAWALRELGQAQVELGLSDEARRSYERSLKLRREIGETRGVGIVINQLAGLERKLGNLDRALELYLEANAVATELGDPVGIAVTSTNVARVLVETGHPVEAHRRLAESLETYTELGLDRQKLSTLRTMAEASLDLGKFGRGRDECLLALELLETIRGELADPDLRARYLAPQREIYVMLATALVELDTKDPSGNHLEEAFTASEKAHARTLLELVKASGGGHANTDDVRLEDRYEAVLSELSAVQTRLLGVEIPDSERAEIEARRLQLDDERREIESSLRRRSARSQVAAPDLEALQRRLGDDTALVEYLVGERNTVMLIVTGDALGAHLLPGSDELRILIEPLRDLMARPGRRDRGRLDRSAADAGKLLLGPAMDRLNGIDRLVVVPDGVLHLLPFEALTIDEVRSVLERWSVSYAPSVTMIEALAIRRRHHAEPSLFAVADPLLPTAKPALESTTVTTTSTSRTLAEGRSFGDLRPLPEARAEVAEVAGLFPPDRAVVLTGDDALERRILDHPGLRSSSHLHFATHALASSDLPEHSGLVLGSSDDDDGLLQAFEIFDLSLDAELVVLSGCETGLGAELSGEGLLGLTRAFLYAGSNAVVISLWPVEDRSTRDLMTAFYRGLEDHEPAVALGNAKRKIAASQGFDHPFHWAPFVIVGGFEPRTSSTPDP